MESDHRPRSYQERALTTEPSAQNSQSRYSLSYAKHVTSFAYHNLNSKQFVSIIIQMADNISEQDKGVSLENQYNSAYDKLEADLGEKFKGHAPTFLRAAKIVDHTIDRALDEHDVPPEKHYHHRDTILRAGVSEFIADGPVGKSLPEGAEYYDRLSQLVDSTIGLFNAREALAKHKREAGK